VIRKVFLSLLADIPFDILTQGRIGGNVMVSRAFGDINYKYPYNKAPMYYRDALSIVSLLFFRGKGIL
jgi:hypothetical protein